MKSDINTNARLFDLVRYQRMELFEAELITSDEYDWLAHGCKLAKGAGSPSSRRLEDYDRIITRMDKMEKALKEISAQNLRAEMDDHTADHAEWEGGYESIVLIARTALDSENVKGHPRRADAEVDQTPSTASDAPTHKIAFSHKRGYNTRSMIGTQNGRTTQSEAPTRPPLQTEESVNKIRRAGGFPGLRL